MKKDFKERYGPWALVVGCVEGMGAAYVERFAGQGLTWRCSIASKSP